MENLNGAYCLESPEAEEIYRYLESLGKLDLWEVIQSNSEMWELSNIPLLLNIMVTVYQGETIYNEEQLFAAYIDECLERVPTNLEKRKNFFYSGRQTRHWLTFLAKQLAAENKTEFIIENMQPSWLENNTQNLIYLLIYCLIYGLIFALIVGLISGFVYGLIVGLIYGLIVGLISVPIFVLISGLIPEFIFGVEKIKPLQALSFPWEKIKKNMIFVLTFVPIFVLIFVLISVPIYLRIYVVIYQMISGVISISNTDIELKHTPNQGIKESLKNSIFIFIITTPFFLLILYLYTLFSGNKFEYNQLIQLILSLSLGVAISLSTGGTPCIQHFSLRLILWQKGLIPWNYEKFLKYAAQRKLIQQVGGRFRFIHDSLRKHFVSYNR